ncbi:hypothetical protein CYY_008365 [Polysphondylium violaceum]|uniref:Pesticidal crystal protein N-terminal domain-containing protein n=1 Tax=Polysphondylium violaceum TaxID=133409 RepID=A0A8J4PNN6_9MYCE|nr:hypothetical protein CYY_008365 [Polysphondylium violaceum]
MYMAANHVSFKNLLLECIIFFGREDKMELLCKLYLQTVVMYIAFLRDTHFNGIDWGLPEEYVNGVDHIKSMESKIQETIKITHSYYSKFFQKLNPQKDEIQSMMDEGIISYGGYRPPQFKCDFRPLLAQLTYADLTQYNLNQIWLQKTDLDGKVEDDDNSGYNYHYRLPVSNRIYIADFFKMNIMRGSFGSVEYGDNSVNSVTGTKGMRAFQRDGLFYSCFYFTEPKNLTFRVLANTDSNAKIEIVIREIPEGEEVEGPEESIDVATNSHSEKIAYKKLYESSSGPIAEFVSQQYRFEQSGSIYFEAKVLGGNTLDLFTLEIIDN